MAWRLPMHAIPFEVAAFFRRKYRKGMNEKNPQEGSIERAMIKTGGAGISQALTFCIRGRQVD